MKEINYKDNLAHKQATRNFAEKFDRRTTSRWSGTTFQIIS